MLLLRTSRGVDPGIPLLRSLGSNAHVWLPGANGVSVASLPSNNYLLSDGSTGYSTVDGVDGLVLDGMGALSATELVTNGTFPDITGWATTGGYGSVSAVAGELVVTANATGMWAYTSITTVVGKTYKLVGTGRRGTIVSSPQFGVTTTLAGTPSPLVTFTTTSNETKELYFVATATTTYVCVRFSAIENGATAYFDNISCKEYTSIHLTQATTANKPLVRRGMLNELLQSNTLTSGSWLLQLTASKSSDTVILFPAELDTIYQAPTLPVGTYTFAVVMSGTGTISQQGYTAAQNIFGITPQTLTATPTLYVATFTATGTNFIPSVKRNTGDTATSVTFGGMGLFKGTWTAAQILAEGGIPTTTATAASNPTGGKYWWSFDGSNDSLLSGNLGITNACTIVIAGRVNSLAAIQKLFAEDTGGVEIYIETTGAVTFVKTALATLATTSSGVIVAGVPFVITCRLSAGTAVIRNLGAQVASAATAQVFAATTGARVGTNFGGGAQAVNGGLGWVVPLPTALSDADCLMVERLVSSQFPNGPVF